MLYCVFGPFSARLARHCSRTSVARPPVAALGAPEYLSGRARDLTRGPRAKLHPPHVYIVNRRPQLSSHFFSPNFF